MHAAVALGPRGAGPTLPSSWSRSVSRPPSGAQLGRTGRWQDEPAAVGRPVTRDTLCPRP